MKTTMSERKSTPGEINDRLDVSKERGQWTWRHTNRNYSNDIK